MTKHLTRLVFGLWIVGAPFALLGCGEEGGAPANPAPAATPAPADAGKAPAPADAGKTPAPEPAK